MKVVWIGCAVLCVIGLICSGSLVMTGRSVLQATRHAKSTAEEYAQSTVKAICRNWDEAELRRQLDPTSKPGLQDAWPDYSKRFGRLQSAGRFYAIGIDMRPENGIKSTRMTVTDSAQFEHGAATITMTLVGDGEAWKIRDFDLKAPDDTRTTK